MTTPPAAGAVLITLTATPATAGTLMGSGTLDSTDITGMIAGMTYLNIHTVANPSGEIRGDINAGGAP